VFEKEQKKKEIDEIIKAFDDEIREMQKEKYRLESDLKNAEMKLILFFEELILLKSMESKDITLTKRLASCRQEKGQILKEINEISRKLKDKKKEIDEIKEKEEDLMIRFHEFCPERSDKYEEIRKFFEKIIKRRRRVEKPEKGDAGEDDEDEDEDAEEEEEEMEEEDEDEDENTIAGLPPEEYKIEDIEKLREDRLDLYEEKEKILQFISDLDNQRRRLENKERAIKTDLEETEEEI
jgi:chromosome segregation ATPase